MSRILKDAVSIAEYARLLQMTDFENLNFELSASIGIFKDAFPQWNADGKIQKKGSIVKYKNAVYQCLNQTLRCHEFSPDKAMDDYQTYPEPDRDGIYPYIYGMKVEKGMKINDPNGKKYKALASLNRQLCPPSQMDQFFMEV